MNKEEIIQEEWIKNMVLEMMAGVNWVAELRVAPNGPEAIRFASLVELANKNIQLLESQA